MGFNINKNMADKPTETIINEALDWLEKKIKEPKEVKEYPVYMGWDLYNKINEVLKEEFNNGRHK
jgi:hypothetical protein